MKRIVLLLSSLAIFASTANLSAGDFTKVPWTGANIETLRTLNKTAIAALVADLPAANSSVIRLQAADIGEFIWADLEGNGAYQLIVTLDVNSRHFYNSLVVYTRDSFGRLASQDIRGWAIGNLSKLIRDINGNG